MFHTVEIVSILLVSLAMAPAQFSVTRCGGGHSRLLDDYDAD